MKEDKNDFYYGQEIAALVRSGVDPVYAKEIADAHRFNGNYEKAIEEVKKEREESKSRSKFARAFKKRKSKNQNNESDKEAEQEK